MSAYIVQSAITFWTIHQIKSLSLSLSLSLFLSLTLSLSEVYGQGVNGHNGVYDPAVTPTDFHKGSYFPLWLFGERAEREGVGVQRARE